MSGVSLRELDGHGVGELRGVGERATLKGFGIETVLDLLMTYPRRWVDRTNEARGRPRRRHRGPRPGDGPLGPPPDDTQPSDHRRGSGRRRHPAPARRLLQPTVARTATRRGTQRRSLRHRRSVPQRLADDQPDRRPHRRPHREDRADLSQSEKVQLSTGARRVDRERPRSVPSPGLGRPAARRRPPASAPRRPGRGAARSTSRRRSPPRIRPAGGWRSTSCTRATGARPAQARDRSQLDRLRPRRGRELVRRFHDALLHPDGAQRRVIGEIDDDLSSPRPMHRLLQGDVGSGKTVVAVSALLSAVQSGNQGPLAPHRGARRTAPAVGARARRRPRRTRPRQPLRRPPAASSC